MGHLSGLSTQHRIEARTLAVQAAALLLHNAPAVHYTETGDRWQWHERGLKAWRGEFPTECDCSAAVSWELYCGLDHFRHLYGHDVTPDLANGEHWLDGYTGTLLEHGISVLGHTLQRADVVVYGPKGSTGKHTVLYVGGGKVISMGSEAGPFLLNLDYRGDLQDIRRII